MIGICGLLLVTVLQQQPPAANAPTNLDFEAGPLHRVPSGWMFRSPTGYSLTVIDSAAHGGRYATLLASTPEVGARAFAAPFTQRVDAVPYRGKRLTLHAFVRVALGDARSWAGLWMRVDRVGGGMAFFDNMRDRPITATEWHDYDIDGDVAEDAQTVAFGALLAGTGRLWVDDFSFTVLDSAQQAALPPPSAEARAYLDSALAIMEHNAVRRVGIDWPGVRARADRRAAGAVRPIDTYRVIRDALGRLGDHHSFFLPPTASQQLQAARETFADTNARKVDGRYGYVRVPSYAGTDSTGLVVFAQAMQDAIRRIDSQGICAWVVDLRGNGGGNMWPMLAGIGPVLGDGLAGAFVAADGTRTSWSYANGAAREADTVVTALRAPYQLRRAAPPVAVLTDSATASSGEVIAISFRGRPRARSFGQPTAGLSTANGSFLLPDSAAIFLTVAIDADRTGATYGARVMPDEVVPSRSAMDAAIRWLATSPPCLSQ